MPEDSVLTQTDPDESASPIRIDPDPGHHPVQSQCMETDPEGDRKSSSQSPQNQIPLVHSMELPVQEGHLRLAPGLLDQIPEGTQNAIPDPEEIPKITIQDQGEDLRLTIQDQEELPKVIIRDPEGLPKATIQDQEELPKAIIQDLAEVP